MRLLNFKLLVFTTITLALLFWLTAIRRATVDLRIDNSQVSVWNGKQLLAETPPGVTLNNFVSSQLSIIHDHDSLWSLPFFKQTIEIQSRDGKQQKVQLSKPTTSEILNELKSQLDPNRPPFAAKIASHDVAFTTKHKISLEQNQIQNVSISLFNTIEIKLSLYSADNQELTLWLRPKLHHDGYIKLDESQFPFKNKAGGSASYYLEILTSLLARNILGSILILITSLTLAKLLPKWALKLPKLKESYSTVISLLIFTGALATSLYISISIFEKIPHSQDEVAYLFQAKNFALGKLYSKSLSGDLSRFFEHEFIVNNGKWFGSFPPGTSLFLAIGEFINKAYIINPLLSAINIILLIFLTKKLTDQYLASVTALLFAISPFFLLVSASFLSHPSALLMTLLAIIAFTEIYSQPRKKRWWILLGTSLGFLSLVRPANALLMSFILLLPLIKTLFANLKYSIFALFAVLPFILFTLYYNFTLTGDPFLLPYNLYSPYNRLGFGTRGTEWGGKYTIQDAFKNISFNLYSLLDLLFRWPNFLTLSFIPFAFLGKFRKKALLITVILVAQITLYFFYFNEGTFLGPRFWYEVIWIIPLLTIMGVSTLAKILSSQPKRSSLAPLIILLILVIIGIKSTIAILPQFKDFNAMRSVELPKLNTPAVVFVNNRDGGWQHYGRFFIKQNPTLNNKIIFARDKAVHNVANNLDPLPNTLLKQAFPDRNFYLYEPHEKSYTPL